MALRDSLSKYKLLFWMVLCFILIRLAVLFTSIDELYNSEDLAMGVAAKEAVKGASLPLFEYQYLNYSGGTLAVGLMAAPFFLLFGPNYLALKLVPLLFSAAALAVFFLLAYEFFSRRTAIIAGLLYIFSSLSWCGYNFYLGFHGESLFFVFLAVYLFYKIIFQNKSGAGYYLFFGLTCGFGLYFSYTFLIALAAIGIIWLIQRPRLFLERGFYVCLAAFLLGFSPWFFYNAAFGFKGLTDVLPQFSEGKNYSAPVTWIKLSWYFLRSLWFNQIFWVSLLDNLFFKFLNAGYTLFYWFCLVYLARTKGGRLRDFWRCRELILFLFPFILFASCRFYGEGSEKTWLIEERYLISLFPFIFLTLALALDKLFSRYRLLRLWTIRGFAAFVILGAAVYARKIKPGDFAKGLKMPGYSYFYLAETFNYQHPGDFYRILENISRLSAPEKYETLTLRLVFDLEEPIRPVAIEEYLKLAGCFEERYRPYFYRLLINGLYYNSRLDAREMVQEVEKIAGKVEPRYRPYFYEGMGAVMLKLYPDNPEEHQKAGAFIPREFLGRYYRGLSVSLYTDDIPAYLQRCRLTLAAIDNQYRRFFLEGMGEVLARFGVTTFMVGLSYDNPGLEELYAFLESAGPKEREYLSRGIDQAIAYFYSPNTQADIYRFKKGVRPCPDEKSGSRQGRENVNLR